MTKVLIATPSKGTVPARHLLSMVNLVKGIDIDVEYAVQLGLDLASNRRMLIRKAQEIGATHIFFVDDDISFSSQENPLKKLLTYDKDIVGVDYNFRQLPLKSMSTPLADKTDTLYPCESIPSGFMLIKMSVFDKISEPWFIFERTETGEITVSDDVHFCRKAREYGFEVFCDPTIKLGHIGYYNY